VAIGGDFNPKKTRIHAWAFKFFPYDIQASLTAKLGSQSHLNLFSSTIFNFASWNNIFLSNRQLSDENRYIMERKMQDKTIGNFLEKPTVLLKRNYIRDTTFTQEKLNLGSAYDRVEVQAQSLARGAGPGGMMSRQMPTSATGSHIPSPPNSK
jgi:hypothetical protein